MDGRLAQLLKPKAARLPARESRAARRFTSALAALEPPRGLGSSAAALLLLASTCYGVVKGGHYDNIVAADSKCYQYCPDGTPREHLSAFDRTGKIEDWNPVANTPTGPDAAAADATRLYVVSEFTKINGLRHVGLAAFSGTP